MPPEFVSFTVAGHAEPAGSKKNVPLRRGYPFTVHSPRELLASVGLIDDNDKSKHWKKIVGVTAKGAMLRERLQPFDGPLWVQIVFSKTRPASHFRTNGELNAEGERHPFPAKKPDVLKLARAVEDAMTGVVYVDDALIVSESIRKVWSPEESVHITVMPL